MGRSAAMTSAGPSSGHSARTDSSENRPGRLTSPTSGHTTEAGVRTCTWECEMLPSGDDVTAPAAPNAAGFAVRLGEPPSQHPGSDKAGSTPTIAERPGCAPSPSGGNLERARPLAPLPSAVRCAQLDREAVRLGCDGTHLGNDLVECGAVRRRHGGLPPSEKVALLASQCHESLVGV